MTPTRSQIILCWLLFTGAMAGLSLVLHAVVPPVMTSIQSVIGIGPLGALMLAAWVALASHIYPPLLRSLLTRRRGARVRKR